MEEAVTLLGTHLGLIGYALGTLIGVPATLTAWIKSFEEQPIHEEGISLLWTVGALVGAFGTAACMAGLLDPLMAG